VTDTTAPPEANGEAASPDRAAQLRKQVVDELIAEGTIVSAPVEATMRKVPRERFAPGVDLAEVYHAYTSVITKRDADGNAISSVSAPHLQAHMLEQAEITVGMRMLEIGSGGYNASAAGRARRSVRPGHHGRHRRGDHRPGQPSARGGRVLTGEYRARRCRMRCSRVRAL
jgi:hypothetical protein